MEEQSNQFTNKEVAEKYEYTGSWIINGKEKRIAWPGTYDGLLKNITPAVAEKLAAAKYPALKEKED